MKTAYLIHGWDGTPDNWWFPWISEELKKLHYKVISLSMPNPKIPIMKDWLSYAEKNIHPDKDTIFIGHSIGCQTILRYLTSINQKVKACFFIAGWFTLDLHLDTKESQAVAKPWLETPIDFKKVKNNCSRFVVFLSSDDEWVNCKENKSLFENNLDAKVIVEEGNGHYNVDIKIPKLLEEIKKV